MQQLLLVIHVIIAIALIGLVLMQHGKGADIGAAFGSGASQTLFGSKGSGSFLVRATAIVAALFFLSSLGLGYLQIQQTKSQKSLDAFLPTTTASVAQNNTQQLPALPLNSEESNSKK